MVSKVLYIMGTARSGTTILEIMLSNNAGVVGGGELTHFFSDGLIKKNRCSCGNEVANCPQWGSVVEMLCKKTSHVSQAAENISRVDRHLGLIRGFAKAFSRKQTYQYIATNEVLIESLGGKKSWVIDSSKYAARALALRDCPETDVYVICLTRSPRGLARAFTKNNKLEQKRKSPLSLLLYYAVVSISLQVASVRLRERVMKLTYERLCRDPDAVLMDIEKWCGLCTHEVREKIANKAYLCVGHIVTGNRLRKERRILFAPDTPAGGELSWTMKIVVTLMMAIKCVVRL